tara:strand:+ start:3823 stop:4554 length:732 start_codon:yes stop_codon:yes gene_type:complete
MVCFKKIVFAVAVTLYSITSFAQITSGRIVYERRTNLKKRFGNDDRMARFVTEENKIKLDRFELIFNKSKSAFIPIEDEEVAQGFMKYLTSQNFVYQDIENNKKLTVMDLWGTETYLKDTLGQRKWKVTESKRTIAGHLCRKAIWEMNDSTRIYAWFAPNIVPSIGPEGFDGLPGAILGLATEDGSVIYFAKEVKAQKPDPVKLVRDTGKNDVYTKAELRAILEEKMGKWMKSKDFDAMFSWL